MKLQSVSLTLILKREKERESLIQSRDGYCSRFTLSPLNFFPFHFFHHFFLCLRFFSFFHHFLPPILCQSSIISFPSSFLLTMIVVNVIGTIGLQSMGTINAGPSGKTFTGPKGTCTIHFGPVMVVGSSD